MKETSSTYKSLKADLNSEYEIKVVVEDTTTYDIDDIMSLKTYPKLFDGDEPSIGNACSTEVDLKVYESSAAWGRMSKFEIFFRLVSFDGETTSEWISAGIYYTDTRSESAGGFLELHGYDAMLTLETTWVGKVNESNFPDSWPITAQEAVELALGTQSIVTLDESVELDDTVAFIGLDEDATIRQTLKDVAAGMGGNWWIDGNTLRFVPLYNNYGYGGSAIVGIAVVGIAIVGSEGSSSETETPYLVIGKNASTFHSSEYLSPVGAVEITAEDGTVAFYGDSEEYILKANGNFSSSNVAQLSLSYLEGFVYHPFDCTGMEIDPVCELGDLLIINGNPYVACTFEFTFGRAIFCNASAPYEEEVNHEYQIEDQNKKALRKALNAVGELAGLTEEQLQNLQQTVNSSIQQTATSILSEVSENYYTIDGTDRLVAGVRSQLTQTANGLEASITNARQNANQQIAEVKSYVRYVEIDGVGTVIVGKDGEPQDFRISPDQISACYNGDPVSYWNNNEQVAPKKIRIPEGGSLQIGSFLIQPRSSGNLSFLWLGD